MSTFGRAISASLWCRSSPFRLAPAPRHPPPLHSARLPRRARQLPAAALITNTRPHLRRRPAVPSGARCVCEDTWQSARVTPLVTWPVRYATRFTAGASPSPAPLPSPTVRVVIGTLRSRIKTLELASARHRCRYESHA